MELKELQKFARENWVPILRDKSAELLCKLISEEQPKKILEIGTCIGYSGILMLENSKKSHLLTIEIDKENAIKAEQNFRERNLLDRVQIINDDAGKYIKQLHEKFDFIFLDGPKGQYIKYLPILKSLLNINGILVADDIFYHGLVKEGYPKHKHRTIVFRLREFIESIKNDENFETEILDLEDGVSVSRLKE